MPVESIAAFIAVSALLSIVPGPDNIFVLTQSALYGIKAGILVTLGLCIGLIFHTSATALGIAAIFQSSVIAFTILKMIGAFYLAYLAWQAFHVTARAIETSGCQLLSSGALFRRGIIMNITNPKVLIFFLAFFPQFASLEHGHVTAQIFFLGCIFIVVALFIFSAIALTAGFLGGWLRESPKFQVYLNRVAGTIFTMLAVKLAFY